MPKEFERTKRISDVIQRELALLVQRELTDPRLPMVTISAVKVSRDLQHARVYFTFLGEQMSKKEVTKALQHASGYLRHLLGQRVALRCLPSLNFVYDESLAYGNHMSDVINQAIAKDKKSQNGEEED